MSAKNIILTTHNKKIVATYKNSEVPVKGDKIFIEEKYVFEVDFRVFNIKESESVIVFGREFLF